MSTDTVIILVWVITLAITVAVWLDVRTLVARQALATHHAAAGFVERMPVHERRLARYAAELGSHGLRFFQTRLAHRNPGNCLKGIAANAAFVGENQGKQAARDRLRGAEDCIRHERPAFGTREQATRENPPPTDTFSVQHGM